MVADLELETHMVLVPIVQSAADVGQTVALEQLKGIRITARDEWSPRAIVLEMIVAVDGSHSDSIQIRASYEPDLGAGSIGVSENIFAADPKVDQRGAIIATANDARCDENVSMCLCFRRSGRQRHNK